MSISQLKAKRDLNYRRGTVMKSCCDCTHFVRADYYPRREHLCKVMGLKLGRAYRISPNGLCDKHDNSEYLARLKAGTSFAKNDQI
jgi:hypothetical protein